MPEQPTLIDRVRRDMEKKGVTQLSPEELGRRADLAIAQGTIRLSPEALSRLRRIRKKRGWG